MQYLNGSDVSTVACDIKPSISSRRKQDYLKEVKTNPLDARAIPTTSNDTYYLPAHKETSRLGLGDKDIVHNLCIDSSVLHKDPPTKDWL